MMAVRFAPYDELNVIQLKLEWLNGESSLTAKQKRRECDEFLMDILTIAYIYGVQDVNENLGTNVLPEGTQMIDAVLLPIAGKDLYDRINEYVMDDGTVDIQALMRVAETEMTRDYNTGGYNTAKASGLPGIRKKWVTMGDDRVRDTHDYLDGMEVGLDERFVTYDGDSALTPGGFELPQNNVNCRCGLTYKRY